MSYSRRVSLSFSIAPLACFVATTAWATPPVLYTQPAYESAVRGDPDDLLLLSGSGLSGADAFRRSSSRSGSP
jgi:hypothetical protein